MVLGTGKRRKKENLDIDLAVIAGLKFDILVLFFLRFPFCGAMAPSPSPPPDATLGKEAYLRKEENFSEGDGTGHTIHNK